MLLNRFPLQSVVLRSRSLAVYSRKMAQQNAAISTDKSGNIILKILAKPGAKVSAVTDVGESEIGVAIAAPAREGEANEELIDYMRGVLGLKKSELSLDKGGKSRSKTLLITSSRITSEQVVAKLKAAAGD
ncbi:unnamed protein product [Cylicocyclus nassatus]|uniref:Uncharacterized protein n=1 Tax=Cylicocyclus nassatus TaxID=53992 RepID=A0AA36M2E5_CYLNA|nr:unnamed protein product [Cylicocyclus nassatus]